jgi:drug/metabolite transporter (DMT)-like permease
MNNPSKAKKLNILIIIAMIIWGGSWASAKAVAGSLPPETLTFWRFFINSISFIPIMFFMREPIKMSRGALVYTFLGAVSMGLYFYLFFKGLKLGYAGAGGVLVTTAMPLVTFILSGLLLKRKFRAKDYTGMTLGLIGGTILLNIYFMICPVLWAFLTICSEKAGRQSSPVRFSFFAYVFCSIIFFFIALPHGILTVFQQGWLFWFNMFYLGVISSTFATTVYFVASSRLDSYRASSFAFIVPFSALVLSWIFLGETPQISTIIGGLTAVTATYVINKR